MKIMLKFSRSLMLGCCLLGLVVCQAEAARRVITFTNTTGQACDDLHIEAAQGITIDFSNTTPFDSERGQDGAGAHNLYNGTVPNGGTAKVTVTSQAGTVQINKWWWTRGGNALRDGNRVGPEKGDDGSGTLSCAGGPAAGDGAILVSIANQQNVFQTNPGDTPDQTLARIESFFDVFFDLDQNPLIDHTQIMPSAVQFAGNVQGDDSQTLRVQILAQDSGQQLELLPVQGWPGAAVDDSAADFQPQL